MPPKVKLNNLYFWLVEETEEDSKWGVATGEDKARQTEEMVHEFKEKLAKLESAANGDTLLHRLLMDPEAAKKCPKEIWSQIISHNPKDILAVFQKRVPLEQAIAYGLSTVVELMISYLEREPALSFKKHPSEGCIKAAFDFYSGDGRLLPIPMDLIQRLVTLATPKMLSTSGAFIPLHQAIRYEVGVTDSKGQQQLVKTLLDKREDTVTFMVEKRFKFNEPQQQTVMPPEDMSPFRWHLWSREQWKIAEKERFDSSVRTFSETEPVTEYKEHPQPLERRTSFATHAFRARTPARTQGMYKTARESGRHAVSAHPREMEYGDKDEGSDVKETEYLAEKDDVPRQRRPVPSTIKSSNDTKGTANAEDTIKSAEEASDFVCAELTRRFLWSTLATPPDEIARANGSQDIFPVWSELEGQKTATTMEMFFGKDRTSGEESNGKAGKDWSMHPPCLGLFLAKHFGVLMKTGYEFTLDMKKQYPTLHEKQIRFHFKEYRYSPILRQVILCRVPVELETKKGESKKRSDQLFFLRYLRERSVRNILKLTVDDQVNPHGDEEIEEAVRGTPSNPRLGHSFDVQILDWRKIDLCPETIATATPNVREVHLRWSGNNSVLRGWSEPHGLPKLPYLKAIHLHYIMPNTRFKRMEDNVAAFRQRIMLSRDHWKGIIKHQSIKRIAGKETDKEKGIVPDELKNMGVDELNDIGVIDHGQTDIADQHNSDGGTASAQEVKEDPWFHYVTEFVDRVPDLPPNDLGLQNVTVALIDDGVDVFDKGLSACYFPPGATFDTSSDGPGPANSSVSGHGTAMALAILKMCPYAHIIPFRLMVETDGKSFVPRPQPASAAKAIREALDRNVDIISMSWTISQEYGDKPNVGLNQLSALIAQIQTERGKRVPLMFCASHDDGPIDSAALASSYPRQIAVNKIFVIGAADASSGAAWPMTSDLHSLHFLFPGVDIEVVKPSEGQPIGDATERKLTGSSIANAYAAGLAALLIHCTRLSVYYTKQMQQENKLTTANVHPPAAEQICTFDKMKHALNQLCVKNAHGQSFANPKFHFEKATEELKNGYGKSSTVEEEMPDSIGPIATLVRNLYM